MNILAIESSGAAASVAIMKDGEVLSEYTINNKKTHSQTLLPMIEEILSKCEMTASDIDYIAVSAGPGSYTGLRIGISTAKGIALGGDIEDSELAGKPCVAVSTLEAMAYNLCEAEGVYICPVIDAKNDRLYSGLYWFWIDDEGNYRAESTIPDGVVETGSYLERLSSVNHGIIFIGDGINAVKKRIDETGIMYSFASRHKNFPRAASLAIIAEKKIEDGEFVTADELSPEYMAQSQAERLRFRRMEHKDVEAVAAIESVSIIPPWSKESFEEAIEKEETYYVVCEAGGKIKGYAGMWIAADEAEITGVAVEPESRGTGLGQDIVRHLLEKGKELGVKNYFLEVRKSNANAIAVYEKCGFERVGERKDFYREPDEDAVVMRCRRRCECE